MAAGLWAAFGAAADFEQVRAVALQGAAVGLKGEGDVTLAGGGGVTVEGLPQGLVDVDIIAAVVGASAHAEKGLAAEEHQLERGGEVGGLVESADLCPRAA